MEISFDTNEIVIDLYNELLQVCPHCCERLVPGRYYNIDKLKKEDKKIYRAYDKARVSGGWKEKFGVLYKNPEGDNEFFFWPSIFHISYVHESPIIKRNFDISDFYYVKEKDCSACKNKRVVLTYRANVLKGIVKILKEFGDEE